MMNLTLKRDPVWLDCLPTTDISASFLILGGDGQQVALPVPLLLAASPMVKSILIGQLPPVYCQRILSLPAIDGDVLQVFVDLLSTGVAACDHTEQIEEVKHVFEMLGVEADIVSYHPESIKVEQVLDIKIESDAEESDVSLNEEKISQLEIIVKIDNTENTDVKADIEEFKAFGCSTQKKSSLKVIIPSASGIGKTKYPCNLCRKNFSSKSGLNRHTESVHCKYCPHKFSEKAHLSAHVKAVHDQIQIFPQNFRWESALKVRVDSVDKEREYPCILCLQKFSKKCKLVSHIKSVHNKKLISCILCRKKFTTKLCLKKHLDSVH